MLKLCVSGLSRYPDKERLLGQRHLGCFEKPAANAHGRLMLLAYLDGTCPLSPFYFNLTALCHLPNGLRADRKTRLGQVTS
jgi:hypothetical protein